MTGLLSDLVSHHLPSPHLQLEWRELAPDDADQLNTLHKHLEREEGSTAVSLRYSLVDAVRQGGLPNYYTLGGFDNMGKLRAFAVVYLWPLPDDNIPTTVLFGGVDPEWGARGIGQALLEWQVSLAQAILPEGHGKITSYVQEVAADRRRLFAAAGFGLRSVYLRMSRDLAAPIPQIEIPDGFTVVPARRADEAAVLAAHNEASVGAWGPGAFTPEFWHPRWQHYTPEWSHVILDTSTGAVAGYVLCSPDRQRLAPEPRVEGFIHRLGVVPAYRHRGIGQALVAISLTAFAASDLRFCSTLVDPAHPHGGMAMYDALGFSPTSRSMVYSIEI